MPWDGVNPAKEPETYDAKDKFQDPVAYFKHKEAMVAEEYVRVAEARVSLYPLWGGTRGLHPRAMDTSTETDLKGRPAHVQLLRSQLSKCYKEAGVNYITDCREVGPTIHYIHPTVYKCHTLPPMVFLMP
jgi:hypothetical protein